MLILQGVQERLPVKLPKNHEQELGNKIIG